MNDLITVAVAAYNVEDYIEKCLESVLAQTYQNLEVLVIDDRGGDQTMDKVAALRINHPRGKCLRLCHHPHNIGTGGVRNTAIEQAHGKYIFFLDGDDYIEPQTIELLYKTIIRTHDQFVMATYREVNEQGQTTTAVNLFPGHFKGKEAMAQWIRQSQRDCFRGMMLWNKLFRLSFLKKNHIRCLPSHRNEDVWFTWQLFFTTTSFSVLPDITLNYLRRTNSTMGSHAHLNSFYIHQFTELLQYIQNDIRTKTAAGINIAAEYYIYYGIIFLGYADNIIRYASHLPWSFRQQFYDELRKTTTLDIPQESLTNKFKIEYNLLQIINSYHKYGLTMYFVDKLYNILG